MAKNLFRVEIVSAEEEMFSGMAQKLFVTGINGEMEVLAGHAPLLTALVPGPVWVVREDEQEDAFVILGGLLEVQPKVTIILADSAMRATDIDEAAAMAAKKAAEDIISKQGGGHIDYSKVHNELILAMAQLRILRKLRGK
jgi:F-type H+-transporting ATPase subunit epsilon